MEHTNPSALPRRILELTGPIPQGFGLEYAINEYLNSGSKYVYIDRQPNNEEEAAFYMKFINKDEIGRRKIYYKKRILHHLDCLRVCFKLKPPKPSAITLDTPVVETEDPFPHIPASGAQGRPTRPIDLTEKENQAFIISTIKNSYVPHVHLELTVKGRGIFVEWSWIAVDCMVPNAERLPKGTDPRTLQIHPRLEDMKTLPEFTRNILREALIPLTKDLMRQDRAFNKHTYGKDSQPEDITHPCNYHPCIHFNHVRAEPHQINADRELCLSGSLCDCPSEYKCLCVGHRARCETFPDLTLCSLKYAYHALAYLDSIENMSIDGSSRYKFECDIPNEQLGTVNPFHSIETYREIDHNLVSWVYSRTRNFELKIVEAEDF